MRATRLRKAFLILLLAVPSTGCCTIFGYAGDQHVRVSANVPGARMFVYGKDSGLTPGTASWSGREKHSIRIECAGYEPYEVTVTQGLNGLIFGNIIFGGIIGILVDSLDGATIVPYPGSVNAKLKPLAVVPLIMHDESAAPVPQGNIGPEYNSPLPPGWK